ncbi:MAG: aromatic-ring-hydroxylating dioxygenase subunit beta [Chloroflexota bacterium]|nr:aromatic-ring-hydroxylating dioxygenase subunit beta [Chloroflexota bacterium]MDE2685023.1 aromatic-ring-hydroxylating dioxygenase subunit beta [Chloroflexota bacterium]
MQTAPIAPSVNGLSATPESLLLQHEVEQTLYLEARLLDDWNLDEWLTLYTEDARYVVPTTDLPEGDPESDLVFIDDDYNRMAARVVRLKSRHAHREYPWSRTRRFIGNVMVTATDGEEVEATASVAVWRFRAGESSPYVGRYDVRLRRVDGHLRLCYKRAILDLEELSDHGALSIIF